MVDIYLVRKNAVQHGVKYIQYMGTTLWINLPVELRNSTSKFYSKKGLSAFTKLFLTKNQRKLLTSNKYVN